MDFNVSKSWTIILLLCETQLSNPIMFSMFIKVGNTGLLHILGEVKGRQAGAL